MSDAGGHIKVLYIPKWYPHAGKNDGIFIQNHARAVMEHSTARISVLFLASESSIGHLKPDFTVEHKIPTLRGGYKPVQSILKKLLIPFRYLKKGKRMAQLLLEKEGKPDLIHIHVLGRNAILGYLLARKYKIPFIITEHWTGFSGRNAKLGYFKKKVYQFLCKRAKWVLPVSTNLMQNMRGKQLNGNYQVVNNVVDMNLFRTEVDTFQGDQEVIHLVHVSTLIEDHKNTKAILTAFVELQREYPNQFQFHIVGGSSERVQAAKDYVQKHAGENLSSILFYGVLEQKEVAKIVRESNLAILYSHFENQPVVLIEALASGLPVITTDVGGIKEYVPESFSIINSDPSSDALKKAILEIQPRILNQEFNKEAIRKSVFDSFSYESVGEKLSQIYLDSIS